MKRKLTMLALAAFALCACTTPTETVSYKWSAPSGGEDNYIVLNKVGDTYSGRYYGTTDEFDPARENYEAGYFVLPMNDLNITGDTLRFSLQPASGDFFTSPQPLTVTTSQQATEQGGVHWDVLDNFHFEGDKHYTGTVSDTEIAIDCDDYNGAPQKRFVKM